MQMTEPSSSPSSSKGPSPKTNGVSTNGTATTNGHVSTGGEIEHEPSALESLLAVSVTVLQQAVDFVRDDLTSDEQLSFRSQYIPGSTIGKHLRHARDHYILLLSALNDAGAVIDELSYDVRTRNTPMETSRTAALTALDECVAQLQRVVPRTRLDDAMTLNAVTPHMQRLQTSFGRELWFAALHAVHHWSMVRVIAGEQNIHLEDSFGYAPSTLVYRGTEGPLGKSKI